MAVDTSRFSNMGQIPGMRFSAVNLTADGTWIANTDTAWNNRIPNRSDGDFVRLGGWQHLFSATENTPVGINFQSHGVQAAISPGVGTQNMIFEAMFSQMRDVRTRETVGLSGVNIELKMGTASTASLNFNLQRIDRTALRTAVVTPRMPDQFMQNGNVNGNARLLELATRLGDPVETNTGLSTSAQADGSAIGRGMAWQLPSYAVTVTGGTAHTVFNSNNVAGPFYTNETVTVVANTPATGYTFTRWEAAGIAFADDSQTTTTFTMPGNAVSVTAVFTALPQHAVTLAFQGAGGSAGTGGGIYYVGDTVNIAAATPAANWHFSHWTGTIGVLTNINSPTAAFTMPDFAVNLTAHFAENTRYTLAVSGATYYTTGSPFFEGTMITAIAPATNPGGHAFENWEALGVDLVALGIDSTDLEISFAMPANSVTLTAIFEGILRSDLTVVNGIGSGTNLPEGVHAIEADEAPAGYTFDRWTGDTAGVEDVYSANTTITLTGVDLTVTATFKPLPRFALTVVGGTDTTNQAPYLAGAVVTVTAGAAPSSAYQFARWEVTEGTGNFANPNLPVASFIMGDGTATITAVFELKPHFELIIASSGTSADTNLTGAGSYYAGAVVPITAGTVPAGYRFVNWTTDWGTLADADAASTTVTMPNRAVLVTANFEALPTFQVTVIGGTSNRSGGQYAAGETVTITANAVYGATFVGWSWITEEGVEPDIEISIVMNGEEKTLVATFIMPAHEVTVRADFDVPEITEPDDDDDMNDIFDNDDNPVVTAIIVGSIVGGTTILGGSAALYFLWFRRRKIG
jgi:uncharacterized repeat protein (TIGR02543 family)